MVKSVAAIAAAASFVGGFGLVLQTQTATAQGTTTTQSASQQSVPGLGHPDAQGFFTFSGGVSASRSSSSGTTSSRRLRSRAS